MAAGNEASTINTCKSPFRKLTFLTQNAHRRHRRHFLTGAYWCAFFWLLNIPTRTDLADAAQNSRNMESCDCILHSAHEDWHSDGPIL